MNHTAGSTTDSALLSPPDGAFSNPVLDLGLGPMGLFSYSSG
jgi:hypothetical protein